MVVFVLSNVGDQVPEILFNEVVGSGLKVVPIHTGLIELKVGFVFWLTVTVNVVFEAHCPVVGVNVYTVVCVLSKAGDQVPVKLFKEVVGSGLKVVPLHIAFIELKVGVVFWFTVIVIVVLEAHCPVVGVNVYTVVFVLSKAGDQVPV